MNIDVCSKCGFALPETGPAYLIRQRIVCCSCYEKEQEIVNETTGLLMRVKTGVPAFVSQNLIRLANHWKISTTNKNAAQIINEIRNKLSFQNL